ncbi:hypothetical protein OH773_22230 (plasmid) [Buttiauxella sp. WJP83]|uniref:hypothetical protein n=1 Tax=Buttiauxella sp. WJP83 TaxID=2986951 RepID=UPI0022DDA0CC|nr:hypothetical protein [Buttiauxella sp. WJP83]WBM72964.1 hypothetical protein OH773_22230 [Buttiauxella sp. WJP83]
MKHVDNAVKNNDLDELTAMLQSLDDPAEKAVRANPVHDDIDDLLANLDSNIAKPVEVVAEEVMAEQPSEANNLANVFEELEKGHESVKVVEVIETQEPSQETEAQQEAEPAVAEKVGEEALNNPTTETSFKDSHVPDRIKQKPDRSSKKQRFSLESKDEAFFTGAGLERGVFMEAFEKAPVKAKDKISNLLNWFGGGPEISIYTVIAIRHILETKDATSNSIKLALMSNPEKPYPLNTASTQAGQMMAVFPATGIATRDGGNLTLNKASPLVKKFIAEYSIG